MNTTKILLSKKDHFFQNLVFVILILANSLILQFHLLGEETSSNLRFNGKTLSHVYDSDQMFYWILLSYFQLLAFHVIFFFTVKTGIRYFALFGIFWHTWGLTNELLLLFDLNYYRDTIKLLLMCTVLFLGILEFVRSVLRKKKPIDSDQTGKSLGYYLLITVFMFGPMLMEKISYELSSGKDTYVILGVPIGSRGFPDFSLLVWFTSLKLQLVFPLIVLFLHLKAWWRYALLFPILLTVYQLRSGLNPNLKDIDAYEIFEAAPLLLIVLALLLFLSRSAYYQSKTARLFKRAAKNVEALVQVRFKKQEHFLKNAKARFTQLKSDKDPNEQELRDLKQHLEKELQEYER